MSCVSMLACCSLVYMFVYVCRYLYMDVCLYGHLFVNVCVNIFFFFFLISVCMRFVYLSVCMYVHIYVCVYVFPLRFDTHTQGSCNSSVSFEQSMITHSLRIPPSDFPGFDLGRHRATQRRLAKDKH